MKTFVIPDPNPRQLDFFNATEKYVLYGGARGGGKSWAVRQKAAMLCLKYPGIKVLIVRRSYPELQHNHIFPLQSILKDFANYTDRHKQFTFPNRSTLRFGYCDSERDTLQYQGQEFDVIFIDEATQLTENQFYILSATLRGVNDFPKRIYLTANPGGVGHEWVKRLFVSRKYKKSENPAEYRFIPATVYDNQNLLDSDPEYVTQLENLPPDLKSAWLRGNWNVFAGQFFSEFSEQVHVVRPFPIPKDHKIYIALDYGLDMLAALWIAVNGDKQAYVFREIYQSGLIVSAAAQKIISACQENIHTVLAPPDLWNRHSDTGESTADIFRRQGLSLTKTSAPRPDGWMALKEWLKVYQDDDGNQTSKLKIFNTCRNLIRTLPSLQFSNHKKNDAALDPHELTHAPDALRYFASYRITPPEQEQQPDDEHIGYDDQIKGFLQYR